MKILLDSCALGRQWNNLRKINDEIILLKPNKKYRDEPDITIVKFARENNYTILSYDEDMYNIWLNKKNFNLIYVRNVYLNQSRNFKLLDNGVTNSIKITDEERKYRQKIFETYITYIRKYVNFLSDKSNNFVIRLGAFEHDKINCLSELVKFNRSEYKNYLSSSIALNDKFNNSFLLYYNDKNYNSKIAKEIEYYT
jgi:predicted nuclease of predicted toxin-antitoxin system